MDSTLHGRDTRTHVDVAVAGRRTGAPEAAWAAFDRAVATSAGYREHLARAGADPGMVRRWSQVPHTDRAAVFGGRGGEWFPGGLTGAAELVCSSGQSGPPFAMGLVGRADRDAMRRRIDDVLMSLGAGTTSPTLLVNALPMGISVPSDVATVANPSVHPDMCVHLLTEVAPAFCRVVLVAEPLFALELARRCHALGARPRELWLFTGGEPVAQSWRAHVAGLLGVPEHRIVISLGAAELGLHLLFETPALAATRARCAADAAASARGTWGGLCDAAYVPTLLTFDPTRLHVEVRRGRRDGSRLVVTPLDPAAPPLVRYDLGDLGVVLDPVAVARLTAHTGIPLRGPVVALAGRAAALRTPGGPIRPESVKERLFAHPALADDLTGRFRLRLGADGVECHLQARDDGPPVPAAVAAADGLRDWLAHCALSPARVIRHEHAAYPFHAAGDWSHKSRYLDDPAGRP